MAVALSLAAAVVAAVAFGAWQQFRQKDDSTLAADRVFFDDTVDDVGYLLKPNAQAKVSKEAGGRTIFDVVYHSGPDGFRVVPQAIDGPDACVLLFGDSFTFGEGVADSDTFAAQIVKRSAGKVAVHNFGIPGWGPHQFLAGLQSGRFEKAVRCKPTDAVFLLIPSHIWRANGITNPWDIKGPRYRLAPDGRPVRDGALGDPDRYNWRRWIGLPPVGKAEAMALTIAVIAEAMKELKQRFPGIRTHLISYRVSSWDDVDLTDDDMLGFEYNLNRAGVTPLPLEGIIPRYRFAATDYIVDPSDTHPNARAHGRIADFILRELLRDPN